MGQGWLWLGVPAAVVFFLVMGVGLGFRQDTWEPSVAMLGLAVALIAAFWPSFERSLNEPKRRDYARARLLVLASRLANRAALSDKGRSVHDRDWRLLLHAREFLDSVRLDLPPNEAKDMSGYFTAVEEFLHQLPSKRDGEDGGPHFADLSLLGAWLKHLHDAHGYRVNPGFLQNQMQESEYSSFLFDALNQHQILKPPRTGA